MVYVSSFDHGAPRPYGWSWKADKNNGIELDQTFSVAFNEN
ncbi:hypothetical protein ACFL01_03490 [Planctomycetota bacterium]